MLATAHYRNGVLLGPLTGKRVAERILSGTTADEFTPFGPERFTAVGD
jgi:glycine oxidase